MNVEAIEIGCVEKFVSTNICGCLKCLKTLDEKNTTLSNLELFSETGRFGSLILACR